MGPRYQTFAPIARELLPNNNVTLQERAKFHYELIQHQGLGRIGYIRTLSAKIRCPTISFPKKGAYFEVGDNSTTSVGPISRGILNKGKKLGDAFDVNVLTIPRLVAESLDAAIIQNELNHLLQRISTLEPPEKFAVPLWAFLLLDPEYSFYIQKCLSYGIRYFLLIRLGKYLSRPRSLAKILVSARQQLTPDSILHVTSPIPPAFIPIFAYLGVDVLDSSFADLAAASHQFIYRDHLIPVEDLERPLCNCPACTHFFETTLDSDSVAIEAWLTRHNRWQFLGGIRHVQLLFRKGGLRELVEAQTHHSPVIKALLRILNTDFPHALESTTPTFFNAPLTCIGSESLRRPVIARFRERIRTRFFPRATSCVLLFPCSAKKPYSTSRSHQRYRKAIDLALPRKFRKQVSEIIYTSPLDVVPRELEYTYPAAHYDIPVTGDWSEEEQVLTIQSLAHLLSKFPKNSIVISHVEPGQQEMVSKAIKQSNHEFKMINTCSGVTSRIALEALTTTLRQAIADFPESIEVMSPRIRTIFAIVEYQFGVEASQMLFGEFPTSLKIRSWYPRPARIFCEGAQLATLNPSTGHLLLTLNGAMKLKDLQTYQVHFDGTQLTGSNLFAVGVAHASPEIRPGDDVIIADINEDIIGTGSAIMSGREMESASRGIAVKIRKKVR